MKKVTIAALIFAATVSSAPLLAQEVSPVHAAVAQYTTLLATYQAEQMSEAEAKAAAERNARNEQDAKNNRGRDLALNAIFGVDMPKKYDNGKPVYGW